MHNVRNGFEDYSTHGIVPSAIRQILIRFSVQTVLCILVLGSMPLAAASSGMAWAGAAESEHGYGTTVQYSPSGDIIASGHGSIVMILDTYTHEEVQTFHVNFFIQSIEFSSDGHYLLIGMESALPNTPATVVFENIDGQYTRAKHTEDGQDIDKISISPDDGTFATSSENGDIVEWDINTGTGSILSINRQYASPHIGHITCLDHSSDGAHLLSGAEDGIIILWNRENQTEVNRWETNEPIADCGFSNDGDIMSWIGGGSLFMRNHDSTQSYFGQYDISESAIELSYTSDDSEIAILTPPDGDARRVDFIGIDMEPFYLSRTMYIGHNAVMMSLHPFDNSIAIATLSTLVAFYSDSVPVEMEIPATLDTDQDNIPDSIDTDDDGDGIIDDFDNICIAGNNCQLQPDQEFIRQFDISINGNDLMITESFHLDSVNSAHIRFLAASSISPNHRVDNQEFLDFEHSVCNEYNQSGIMVRWNTHLEIEGNSFNPHSVQCNIDSGLSGTRDDDKGTRIKISWTVTGTIENSVSVPYNISIIAGMPTPRATIAQNVHSFPIHVEIEDVRGPTINYEVWNRRDADLYLQMEIAEEDTSKIGDAVGFMSTYWYVFTLIAIISISGILLLIIRRKNSINFEAFDDGKESDALQTDEWEDLVDEAAAWDENMSDEYDAKKQPSPPSVVARDIRGKPKPPGAVQRDIARQRRQTTTVRVNSPHKVKRTKKTETSHTPEDDSVEFKQLLNPVEDSAPTDQKEDDEISDAIAFITSENVDKPKRKRPVRRKKSKD